MKKSIIFGDVLSIKPFEILDHRGSFSEIYNKEKFNNLNIEDNFVQDNRSISQNIYTIRGLHFQSPPFAQSKLLRVEKGSIFDVFIDLRRESESYECYGSCIMKPDDGWVYIPKGYAHGFLTLSENTTVLYKVDNYYKKENDLGIRWNDPNFDIKWPVDSTEPHISEKDLSLPIWKDIRDNIFF